MNQEQKYFCPKCGGKADHVDTDVIKNRFAEGKELPDTQMLYLECPTCENVIGITLELAN